MSDDELSKKFKYQNGTLKNKFNETNSDRLRYLEYRTTVDRAEYLLSYDVKIRSVDDLVKIHKFLFKPIYDWAGKIRNYELSKGGSMFMWSASIPMGIKNINDQLQVMNQEESPTALEYAQLIDSVNYLHPFREGNGRATKLFVQMLAANHSQELYFDQQDQEVIKSLASSDLNRIAKFIELKKISSKSEVINRLVKTNTTKKQNYQTYLPPKQRGRKR